MTAAAWQDGLRSEMRELNRWIMDRLIPTMSPDAEWVPALRYRDLAFLRSQIARGADMSSPLDSPNPDVDVRVALSRFTRQYSSSVVSTALVALGCGVAIDMSAARCTMKVEANIPFRVFVDFTGMELVTCAARPNPWGVRGREVATVDELREHAWRTLFGGHIAPLFTDVLSLIKVNGSLAWSNAAEWVANVSDAADEYLTPERARPYYEDRVALLERDLIPGVPGPNPLKGIMHWEPADSPLCPHGVQTRQICCLTYMLPDRLGRLCQNCLFLPPPERVAMVEERHGRPMGNPPGPATERAIQAGLRKLGLTTHERDHVEDST